MYSIVIVTDLIPLRLLITALHNVHIPVYTYCTRIYITGFDINGFLLFVGTLDTDFIGKQASNYAPNQC